MKLFIILFIILTNNEELKKMRHDFNHMSKSEEVTTRKMDVSTKSKPISETMKILPPLSCLFIS